MAKLTGRPAASAPIDSSSLIHVVVSGVSQKATKRQFLSVDYEQSSISVTSSADLIAITNTAGPRTVTISSASIADVETGSIRMIAVKDESAGAGTNNITINTEAGELIDGLSSITISVDSGSATMYTNGLELFTLEV